ncbi:MAG: DUF4330 family protein [Clostridia bacterium]|nr:DUF4330 family protein [Clostridia bacterium]
MAERQKRKFNILDIFLLAALVLAVAATVLGLIRGIGATGERVTLRYIVEVSPIDSDFTSKVAVGNGIYSPDGSQRLGTVTASSASPAYFENSDSLMEGSSVLYITAEADAVRTDTGYLVGDTLIGVGRELELRLPGLYCVGECVSIEIKE